MSHINAASNLQVARGNCFLRVSVGSVTYSSCVIYALKKFTGGLGDDDDRDKGDNFTWQKYFTKVSHLHYHQIIAKYACILNMLL